MKSIITLSMFCALLAGCASNPTPVQLSPGVYYISREDKAGIFGNPSAMKADVIREANEFAAKQGKVAIAVSTQGTEMHPGHFATFDYQFRLVDPDSPAAKGTNVLVPTPNVRTEVDVRNHDAPQAPEKRDLYDELAKLDKLHKDGVLTDAEFEAQKKKLLGEQ